MSSRSESTADRAEQAADQPRSTAEWVTLAVVLVVLGAVIGTLIVSGLRPGEDEPTFSVEIDTAAIVARSDRFYVPLRVQNTGRSTAEDVVVRAAIMQGDQALEEAELTFAFVAGGEAEDGVAVFGEDPAQGQLEAGVVSFLQP